MIIKEIRPIVFFQPIFGVFQVLPGHETHHLRIPILLAKMSQS